MSISAIEKLSNLQPTLFEEDSYFFLQHYQNHKVWYCYDSNVLGVDFVNSQIDKFALSDGRIPRFTNFDNEIFTDFWSTVPLGVFKFKFLENMSYGLLNDYKKIPGYLVEGMYWANGFFYLVKDQNKIVQSKLFMDINTKQRANYQ